ncbi:MAG: general secretion pathway protein [Methylobacterium sp.]|nr:general secretion pathway protein [Methylobacterium sp.]
MYFSHFGLKQPPFKITPNTEFFFSGGNRGAVLDALIYAVTSGEGIVKVVGEVGSGKTMLCRMLESLLPQNVESVYLANPSVAPEDILHAIAFELHLELPETADRLQVMHALQNYLLQRYAENRQVVIFIEEAQGMPLATLEEIRLLSNLETKNDKLLQIVLFGQPELDENLNQTQIRQLRERITHSFNLGPLLQEDIGEYLIFRLRTAGYFGPQLFTKGAIRKIAAASKGLVRRVNILADKAMLAAFADNAYAVSPRHVVIAIKDSEFGAEQSGAAGRYPWPLIAGGTLLIGLAAGFAAHMWLESRLTDAAQGFAPAPPVAVLPVIPATPSAPAAPASAIGEPPPALPAATVAAKAPAVTPPQPPAAQPATGSAETGKPADQVARTADTILDKRLLATEAWLAHQPPTTVTIQLMGTDKPDLLRYQLESLSRMIALDEIFIYQIDFEGKPFYTLLYGSYPDRNIAKAELQALPKSLRAYRPHLRTVGGLQKEIKQL